MLNDQIYKQLFFFFIDQILLLKCECGCFVISWPITHQITVFYHGRPPLCYITSWLHSAVVTTVVSAGGYINCLLFVVSCVCGHSCWNRVHGGSVIKWLHQNASPYEHQHVLILHTHTLQYSRVDYLCHIISSLHVLHASVTKSLSCFFFSPDDAFTSGSSPFLSGYQGPSPLTSDPTYRSSNPSSLQMAQLWASHAHEGKKKRKASTNAYFLCAFVFLQYMREMHMDTWHHFSVTFLTVCTCPMPRRLVPLFLLIIYTSGILFHFCLPASSSTPGSVLNASRFPCPPPSSQLHPVICNCNPSFSYSFEAPLSCLSFVCLSMPLLPHFFPSNISIFRPGFVNSFSAYWQRCEVYSNLPHLKIEGHNGGINILGLCVLAK